VKYIDAITWRPGFSDPDPLGWITFGAYAVTSVLCVRAARSGDDSPPTRQSRRIWFLFALALGFLGVNLQLDLHALFFQWARQMAETQGWYEWRRNVQHAFFVIVSGTLIAAVVFLSRRFRSFARTQKLAVSGVLLIIAYVLIRNATFNHIDDRSDSVWNMKDRLRLVELTGVTAIAVAAWRFPGSKADR
jgi:hypothetical protein